MQSESQSAGHQSWLSTMTEARENSREALADAMVEVNDPGRAIWPVSTRQAKSPAQHAALRAHVSVIDYSDLLRPYSDQMSENWEEKLDTVKIEGYKDLDVSLDVLDEWESVTMQVTETERDELEGVRKIPKNCRLLLPVESARKCYRQLNQIVCDLGFAAQVPMQDYDEVDPV